jgi:EmrB/QacA subfamily drug resistance transporter
MSPLWNLSPPTDGADGKSALHDGREIMSVDRLDEVVVSRVDDTRSAPEADTQTMGTTPTVVAVALASLMVPLAVTTPAVALTRMSISLSAGSGAVQWVLNAYNLTFAASLLAAGKVADRYGRRRVLMLGTIVYGLMSLMCGLASNIVVVDVARAVQGIGSAGILTSGAATLAATFDGPARARAFGILGASFGAGLALGPLVSGVLVDTLSWRSVFFINLVFAVGVLLLGRRVRASRDETAGRLDLAGLGTFSVSLFMMMAGFVTGPLRGWLSPLTIGAFVACVVLMGAFVAVETHSAAPAFDLSFFRRPTFVAVMSQPFTIVFGFVILVVYLPPYFQGVDDMSAAEAGAMLLPLMLPVLIIPLCAGVVSSRIGIRRMLTLSAVLIGVGALWLLTLTPHESCASLVGPLAVFGIGVGSAFGVMDNAAVSVVPVEQAGAAAGMFNTIRITGESIATAGAAALVSSVTLSRLLSSHVRLPDAVVRRLAVQSTQGRIATNVRDAAHGRAQELVRTVSNGVTSGLHVTLIVVAVLALLGAGVTYVAMRDHDLGGAS